MNSNEQGRESFNPSLKTGTREADMKGEVSPSMQNAQSGQNISILFYVDGRPFAVNGTVGVTSPLTLVTNDPNAKELSESRRAMLMARNGNDFAKAEAQVKATQENGAWTIVANDFGWEQVDRRRYDRYEIKTPVTVRAVVESEDGAEVCYVEALTEDVSLGGAWLKSDTKLESGLLVEFQSTLNGHQVRALGVVRWADTAEKTGFGVEFMEFLGSSRQSLHQFLTQRAA